MYEIPEERDKAAGEWEQIANAGDSYAQYIMGLLYRDGGRLCRTRSRQKAGWSCRHRSYQTHNTLKAYSVCVKRSSP